MIAKFRHAALTLVFVLAGCGSSGPAATTPTTSPITPPASTEPSEGAAALTVAAFGDIHANPVSAALAAKLQAALASHDVAGGGGISATVMTAQGTWSG